MTDRSGERLNYWSWTWQDWILGLCGFTFALSLLPSVLGPNKPDALTCWSTVSTMTAVTLATGSMKLRMATLGNTLVTMCWFALAFQTTRMS